MCTPYVFVGAWSASSFYTISAIASQWPDAPGSLTTCSLARHDFYCYQPYLSASVIIVVIPPLISLAAPV